jgi:hypothetical protein
MLHDHVWTLPPQPNDRRQELSDRDQRLLLDVGLTRRSDGKLALASDPTRVIAPPVRIRWWDVARLLARLRVNRASRWCDPHTGSLG